MNTPSSQDLLVTLIRLLEDQENVNITYECEGKETHYEQN